MAKVHGELRPADAHVVQAVPPKTASWEGSQLNYFEPIRPWTASMDPRPFYTLRLSIH